jgi:outer membrane protein assembly factor BamB
MNRIIVISTLWFLSSCSAFAQTPPELGTSDDWARWRGPTGNGIAAQGQTPPTRWDSETNVVWKTPVPGRGHASPIIVDDKIFLATADESAQTQSVLCFHRLSGKPLWQTEVNQGEFNPDLHRKNTHASPTIATDREHVFAVFNNHQALQLVSLDLHGKIEWTKNVGKYEPNRPFGFGASPIVYRDMVIVTNQSSGDSAITAFDTTSGEQKWRTECQKLCSYSTPVVALLAGKPQLLLSGTFAVRSYDPATGIQNWSAPAKWEVTCGTMIWSDDIVFASGGYPPSQTIAVNADGSGKEVWQNTNKSYEQSMLVVDGYIYTHSDNGGIYCWRGSDGQEMWKQKFGATNPAQSASPVYANGNIYFTAENGQTLVIKSNPETFESVATNRLGDESFASMALCGNQIFTRVAQFDAAGENRQEWLYCLGE